MSGLDPGLERPQPDRALDRWWFEFSAVDLDLFGWVEFRWFPGRGAAHYSAALVGRDRPLIVVVDDDVPMSQPTRSLEFRHHGLWAHHVCESPWEHWTVGLECYGVGVNDPHEALGGPAWGDRVPVGLDVEWEALLPGAEWMGGVEQRCHVSGEVLLGDAAHELSAFGWRGRGWDSPRGRARLDTASDIAPASDNAALPVVAGLIAHAPVSGASPQPWRHRRSAVARPDGVGWIEWDDQLASLG